MPQSLYPSYLLIPSFELFPRLSPYLTPSASMPGSPALTYPRFVSASFNLDINSLDPDPALIAADRSLNLVDINPYPDPVPVYANKTLAPRPRYRFRFQGRSEARPRASEASERETSMVALGNPRLPDVRYGLNLDGGFKGYSRKPYLLFALSFLIGMVPDLKPPGLSSDLDPDNQAVSSYQICKSWIFEAITVKWEYVPRLWGKVGICRKTFHFEI